MSFEPIFKTLHVPPVSVIFQKRYLLCSKNYSRRLQELDGCIVTSNKPFQGIIKHMNSGTILRSLPHASHLRYREEINFDCLINNAKKYWDDFNGDSLSEDNGVDRSEVPLSYTKVFQDDRSMHLVSSSVIATVNEIASSNCLTTVCAHR